jgi:uncharacterized protein YkwD
MMGNGDTTRLQKSAANTSQYTSPLEDFSDEWNDPKYAVCNTAASADYMTASEKKVIHVLNLVRMNPKLFASTVISSDYYYKDNSYFNSLLSTLEKMEYLPLLGPDNKCFTSAHCHAASVGKVGYTGHNRITVACRKAQFFQGECCQYGYTDPVDIIVNLLVDEGVPSLGHRNICLGSYNALGVSIQPHKTYTVNTVMDFRY